MERFSGGRWGNSRCRDGAGHYRNQPQLTIKHRPQAECKKVNNLPPQTAPIKIQPLPESPPLPSACTNLTRILRDTFFVVFFIGLDGPGRAASSSPLPSSCGGPRG